VCAGEVHEGQYILFTGVHQVGKLRHLGAKLVSNPTPLDVRGRGIGLDVDGTYAGQDNAALGLAGMGGGIAGMQAAPPPSRHSSLPTAALSPLWALEMTNSRHASRAGPRGKSVQKVSASETPTAMPSTSCRLSPLTPTVMVAATETMRPASLTFT
jgi:hypothetical protein